MRTKISNRGNEEYFFVKRKKYDQKLHMNLKMTKTTVFI